MNTKALGIKGEDMASVVLMEKGYDIIARNYVTRFGEIDIIAKKGETLIFCEVKTRLSDSQGKGREAVDQRKQEKIRRCAEIFLMSTWIPYEYCEFHVIEISIDHLEACF
jgi:putative endonuclease